MNAPEIGGPDAAPTVGDEPSAFAHRTFDLARSRLDTGVDPHVGRRSAVATATFSPPPETPEPRTAGHPS